jgi:hypothetical protein
MFRIFGPGTRPATVSMSAIDAGASYEQHVGARFLVGVGSVDRVVETVHGSGIGACDDQ